MTDTRWNDMAAAYALGALDAEEREAFEARLAEDAELRRLVQSYRSTASDALAGAVPRRSPPTELKARVLARAREARPPSERRATEEEGRLPPGSEKSASAPGRRRGPPARIPWLLLAASLAGLLWLGVRNADLRRDVASFSEQLTEMRTSLTGAEAELARVDSLAEVLAGPDVRLATLTGETEPTLRLVWNPERQALLVAASDLPAPPAGRTYQLWGIRGTQAPVSLGTFETGPGGRVLVTLSPGVDPDFDVSALTEEPAGGSPQPTSQPFLVGTWRAALD